MGMRRLALMLCLVLWALPAGAWEDAGRGVRVPDPPGWEIREAPNPRVLVRYFGPPGPGPRPSLWVHARATETELDRSLPLEVVRALASSLEGFKLLGSRATAVQGYPAHRLGYRAGLAGHEFQATQVFWVRDGQLYVVTLTGPLDRFSSLAPVLERTLEEMEFFEPSQGAGQS